MKTITTLQQFNAYRIDVGNNHILLDAMYNPEKKMLTIKRIQGDVTIITEAIKNFCIERGNIETIISPYDISKIND